MTAMKQARGVQVTLDDVARQDRHRAVSETAMKAVSRQHGYGRRGKQKAQRAVARVSRAIRSVQ